MFDNPFSYIDSTRLVIVVNTLIFLSGFFTGLWFH